MIRPPLLADENVYRVLVEALRSNGWNIVSAADDGLAGATDETVLERAKSTDRILLTFDRDFADLRYLPQDAPGILLLRFRQTPVEGVIARVVQVLSTARADSLRGSLVVITPTSVRRRSLLRFGSGNAIDAA